MNKFFIINSDDVNNNFTYQTIGIGLNQRKIINSSFMKNKEKLSQISVTDIEMLISSGTRLAIEYKSNENSYILLNDGISYVILSKYRDVSNRYFTPCNGMVKSIYEVFEIDPIQFNGMI